MTSIINIVNSIGKSNVEKMRKIGIDSIEKLAASSVERLLTIDGIGVSKAKDYIRFAQQHIERIKAKQKIYAMINKAGMSEAPKATDKTHSIKKHDNNNNSKVPISSIQKIASSSIDELSKIKGMSPAEAQRYIEIANKYVKSMRIEETTQKNQALGFIKFDEKRDKKNLELPMTPKQKQDLKLKLEKPLIDLKLIKKPIIDNKVIDKPVTAKTGSSKPSQINIKQQTVLKTFFDTTTMQRIRFLHFKIKKLEELIARNVSFDFSELNNIIDYVQILNTNYKTQSQIKIFKELEITSSFYDPMAKREIQIWDLIFECARALEISARTYSSLSARFEAEDLMENAIVAMVECSKMYKTAAYFSAACTRQEDKGIMLSVETLEMKSEEARILAQNFATISEEKKKNYSMAANLSAGLSALSKRLAFLKKYNDKEEKHFKAQYTYDVGRACHLNAKSLLKLQQKGENKELINKYQKKANYYYLKAEETWESMLKQCEELTEAEKKNIKNNLIVVNEKIIENDVEIIDDNEALEIQDPEPLIIIPENLAPFMPRTTNYLTKYKQTDLNFDAYLRYKNLMSEVMMNKNKIEELRNNKAGVGRTLKQLQILYDNNDIDINSFTELFEKYSIKLESIESEIQSLLNPEKKINRTKPQKEVLKTIM